MSNNVLYPYNGKMVSREECVRLMSIDVANYLGRDPDEYFVEVVNNNFNDKSGFIKMYPDLFK